MDFEQFKKTKDQIFEQFQSGSEQVASKIATASRQGIRKTITKLLDEFDQFAPLLEEVGFIVGDIELRVTIPPALIITLEQAHGNVSERLEQLSDDAVPTKLQLSVLTLIREAYLLEDIVAAKGHVIGQFELTFSIPPSVSMHLNSNQSRVFSALE